MITQQYVRERIKNVPQNGSIILEMIAEVEDLWESMTRRLWNFRTNYVQTWRLPNLLDRRGTSLRLDLTPVQSVTIQQWWPGNQAGAVTLVSGTDYDLVDADSGRIVKLNDLGWSSVVQATVTGGYTSDTCPSDVKRALLTQLHFMMRRFDEQNIALSSQSYEKGQTNLMTADLHPFFKELADQRSRVM